MTYGSHQITSLDEFESYLQGENLYQKYEVIHLNWDCRKLRSQFDERYISHSKSRIRRENETLIFIKPDLDGSDFNQWSQNALHHLSFGQVQKIDNKAKLVPAMMVRLFTSFRFRSGHLIKDVKNNFTNKCTS